MRKKYLGGALALAAFLGVAALVAPHNGPLHVATNAELTGLSTEASSVAIRDGFTTAGDTLPLAYTASASTCSLNSGNGDNGSQVKSQDGKCWIAAFPPGHLDARWWGVTYPIVMTVASTGTDDSGGMNYCLTMVCKTVSQAVSRLNRFDIQGQAPTINIGAGTFTDRIAQNAPLSGSAQIDMGRGGIENWQKGGANALRLVGAGSGSTTLQSPGDANACYTLLANYGGAFYLDSIKVTYSPGTCSGGAATYGQAHGKFTFGNDVVIGGTSTNAIVGEEQAFFWVKPGWSASTGLTIDGTFTNAGIALSDSMFQSDPPLTINGSFGSGVITASDLSDVKLSGKPPIQVKSGGSVTGPAFSFSGNATLLTSFVTTFPGTVAGQMVHGARWDGAVSPTTVIGQVGMGSGGRVSISASATPNQGLITMNSGTSGAASSGTVSLHWPYATLNSCVVYGANGTLLRASMSFKDSTHPVINWDNFGSSLAKNTSYYLVYLCQ